MVLERVLINWAEEHPEEMKNLLLIMYRKLSLSAKQELVREFLGKELFETLRWCAGCRKNHLDLAKAAEGCKI